MFSGESDEFTNVRCVLWKSDRLWHFAIDRSVCRVQRSPQIIEIELSFEFRSELFPIGLRAHKTRSYRLGTIASRNPGRLRAREVNLLVLRVGDLVHDLDVNYVAVNDRDAFILSVVSGVVIDGGVFTVPGNIRGVYWLWIIVINQI
jgi:hypothetical protein